MTVTGATFAGGNTAVVDGSGNWILAVVAGELNANTTTALSATQTDGAADDEYLTIETSEQIKYASPWGQLFPEPMFDDVFKVINWRIVGEKHLKLDLEKESSGAYYAAIAFNKTDVDLPEGSDDIRAVYRLDVNEFRGKRSLQLIVQHIEAA